MLGTVWRILTTLCLCAWLGLVPAQSREKLGIVVTIAPIHSLVAGITAGVSNPKLLMPGGSSPHAFALKPSDARALRQADVIVRVSQTLETFLERPIAGLGKDAKIITLDEIEGMTLLGLREGGIWGSHAHEHKEGQAGSVRASRAHNPHIWLDPSNAIIAVDHIAKVLSAADPANAEAYWANARGLKSRLAGLDRALKSATEPIASKPYVVFHDAYAYFENRYGLQPVGAVTISPDYPPGARRLGHIRAKIAALAAKCVFSEPQFEPKLIATVTRGTPAKNAVLDPLGAALEPGPNLYFKLMRNLAKTLNACLT